MAAEDDLAWTRLKEAWQRLRWARQRTGMTQANFASAVRLGRTGYIKYEANPEKSQHTQMTADRAMQFAKRLRVRWEWLLEGHGPPWINDSEQKKLTEPQERAVQLLDDKPVDQQARLVEAFEQIVRLTGT